MESIDGFDDILRGVAISDSSGDDFLRGEFIEHLIEVLELNRRISEHASVDSIQGGSPVSGEISCGFICVHVSPAWTQAKTVEVIVEIRVRSTDRFDFILQCIVEDSAVSDTEDQHVRASGDCRV